MKTTAEEWFAFIGAGIIFGFAGFLVGLWRGGVEEADRQADRVAAYESQIEFSDNMTQIWRQISEANATTLRAETMRADACWGSQ